MAVTATGPLVPYFDATQQFAVCDQANLMAWRGAVNGGRLKTSEEAVMRLNDNPALNSFGHR
jgi:hypothetical protein